MSCTKEPTNYAIKLNHKEGFGLFRDMKISLRPRFDTIYYKGVPQEIEEYVITGFILQKDQFYWNQYLNNKITKEKFEILSTRYKIDTSRLTSKSVDSEVLVLIGSKNDKRVIIIDSNNDEDFSGEKVLEYTYPLSRKEQRNKAANLPIVTASYEYYEFDSTSKKTINLMPSPYSGGMTLTYGTANPLDDKYLIFVGISEHFTNTFTLNNEVIEIHASNGFTEVKYLDEETTFYIFPSKNKDEFIPKKNIPYKLGDVFNTNGIDYSIDSISAWGSQLFISYVGENNFPSGVNEGFYIPKFQARKLDSTVFSLDKYSNKYVLLDFWGTWCKPCIAMIPELKKIKNEYEEKKFELVSVALDDSAEGVAKFANSNEMNWDHVFVDMNESNTESLVEKLKVSSFPTTILISPEGQIIARNKSFEEMRAILDDKL